MVEKTSVRVVKTSVRVVKTSVRETQQTSESITNNHFIYVPPACFDFYKVIIKEVYKKS